MAVDDRRTGTWVTYVQGSAADMRVRRCRLSIVGGPDSGKSVELESSWVRVGAREGCDLVLTDPQASGHHFEIVLDEGGYRLRDLDSTNGTWVSGLRIRDAYLNPGTVIALGETRLRFEPLDSSVKIELAERDSFGGMVGKSVAIRALFARLQRVAPSDASVLVTGETGTGKELVAEAIHEASPRASGPFVVVDCGSIPANLIGSELFGHERGAFTGAVSAYAGAFERAHGGTVFLDEIGELPLDLQPSLLGVLERKRVRRIGGNRDKPVDIRVVAATNRDLAREMNKGTFREDLYYRLAVVKVHVPPLRKRLDDLPLLVEHFLKQIPGGDRVKLKQRTIENLSRHDYPGNVRELRNLIERAVVLAGDEVQTWPGTGTDPSAPAESDEGDGGPSMRVPIDASVPFKVAKRHMVAEFERRYLISLLKEHGGNVSQAARAAGLDRMTVHKMITRAGLTGYRG